jgi:hypothetical protein
MADNVTPNAAAASETKFRVFFAWQSDSPNETNRRLIRAGLRHASSRLEGEHPGLHVVLDEATRDMPGSPDIPSTILAKIREADAFVADITTITDPAAAKPCPNPNVLIELGYAVSQVGWPRIVLLFNEAHGQFPTDVPWDVGRHRISRYTARVGEVVAPRGAGNQALFQLMYDALAAIFTTRPPKPSENDEVPPAVRKRRRDVEALRALLTTMDLAALDYFFLDRIHVGQIPSEVFHYWEDFNGIVTASLFHLYDGRLSGVVQTFHKNWAKTFSFGEYFEGGRGNYSVWRMPGDVFKTRAEEEAWHAFQQAGNMAHRALNKLLKYVRDQYLEIDIRETSGAARASFLDSQQEDAERFDPIRRVSQRPAKRRKR